MVIIMSIVYYMVDNVPWVAGIELYLKSSIVMFQKIVINICFERNAIRFAYLDEYLFIFLL